MKTSALLSAVTLFLSLAAMSQDEWNSTNNPTSAMYRAGNVGIGISSAPTLPLVVNPAGVGTKVAFGGNALLTGGSGSTGSCLDVISSTGSILGLFSGSSGSENFVQLLSTSSFGCSLVAGRRGGVGPFPDLNINNNGNNMKLQSDGKFVIGNGISTTPGTYKLYVEDGILTEKVKVAVKSTANWSDYVFAADYKLKPMSEVADYIKANKHLPGIPSAEEVVKDGIDVATMDAKLLQKIEELTLYVLQLNTELEKLKAEKNNSSKN